MTNPAAGRPLVSIGIPTYNRGTSLTRALESVLAQDYPDIEVIISDNASTDGTEALCRQAASVDPRIRYFRRTHNEGVSSNFRAVLAAAQGEFFMWLSDDDWLDPSYLSRCMAVLVSDPSYSVVCGSDRYYREGKFAASGVSLNLNDVSGAERVVSYYRQVAMNGAFYGVMRRALVTTLPFQHVLGADWLVVAGMAFYGKIATLSDVSINRSLGGVSRSWPALAEHFGWSGFRRDNPVVGIAAIVFADIGWRSPAYARLGSAGRLTLSLRVVLAMLRRHYPARDLLRMTLRKIVAIARKARPVS
jgi:glycosyltransferase involved in cell wall biosynthesis